MDGAVLCTDTSSLQTDAKTVRTDVAILWKDANVFPMDMNGWMVYLFEQITVSVCFAFTVTNI